MLRVGRCLRRERWVPGGQRTRNLTTLYRPHLPRDDMTRYYLPDENFRITLAVSDDPRLLTIDYR